MANNLDDVLNDLIDKYQAQKASVVAASDAAKQRAMADNIAATQASLQAAQARDQIAQNNLLAAQQKVATANAQQAAVAANQLAKAQLAASVSANALDKAQRSAANAQNAPVLYKAQQELASLADQQKNVAAILREDQKKERDAKQKEAAAAAERAKVIAESTRTVQAAFDVAAVTATGMAAVANPLAWSTMTDSFKLVAMQLGQYFLPAIVEATVYAQEFAEWLHNLSPETKSWLTTTATVAGGLYAFSTALRFVNALTLGMAGKFAAGVPALLSSIPAPALGAGAALAGVAVAAYAAKTAMEAWAAKIEKEALESSKSAQDKFTREQVTGSADYQRIAGIADPVQRKAEMGKLLDEARKKQFEETDKLNKLRDPTSSEWWLKHIGSEAEQAPKAKAATDRSDMLNVIAEELINGNRFIPSAKQGPDALLGSAGKRAQYLSGLLMHFPKEMQPQFTGIDQARKMFQIGALKDPLEQQMLIDQRAAAKEFLKLAPILLEKLRKGQPVAGVV